MIYGYARVSTYGQAKDGNSLEDQEKKLRAAGAETIYSDVYTGTKIDRPHFDELKEELKDGDTLIVTKLDRIARSATQGTELVNELLDRGVTVKVLNMGTIDDTSTGKLILGIMFSFAEFERDMIVQRTQEGKAIAKTKPGFHEGRPRKFTKEQLDHAMRLIDEENWSYNATAKMTGISRRTLLREHNRRNLANAQNEIKKSEAIGKIKLTNQRGNAFKVNAAVVPTATGAGSVRGGAKAAAISELASDRKEVGAYYFELDSKKSNSKGDLLDFADGDNVNVTVVVTNSDNKFFSSSSRQNCIFTGLLQALQVIMSSVVL